MIAAANPDAEADLWLSHSHIRWMILQEYETFQPIVATYLSNSYSKLHFSFDGWSTRNQKKSSRGHPILRLPESTVALPTRSK